MKYPILWTFKTNRDQINRLKAVAKHRKITASAVLKNYIESEYEKLEPQLT